MSILKLLHVLFLFIWIGSLLTLTRFLGYIPKEEQTVQTRLIGICKRMYTFVQFPSMILAILSGLFLLKFALFGPSLGWFHSKMTFATLLIVSDLVCGYQIRKTAKAIPLKASGIKFKILHGVTTLILIGVLSSIYLMRNKEQEIKLRLTSQIQEQR